jgi:hypothetical protein
MKTIESSATLSAILLSLGEFPRQASANIVSGNSSGAGTGTYGDPQRLAKYRLSIA